MHSTSMIILAGVAFAVGTSSGVLTGSTVDPCATVTCQNNGVCRDLNGFAQCYCPYGYEGKYCEQAIPQDKTPPLMSGCLADSTVLLTQAGSVALRVPAFWDDSGKVTVTGDQGQCRYFETDSVNVISYTGTDVAGNSETCEFTVTAVSTCTGGNVCQNGGYCDASGTACVCPDGYEGLMCEYQTDIDMDQCLNGGSYHVDHDHGCYHGGTCAGEDPNCLCHCPPGFWGIKCEHAIPLDTIAPIVEGCPDNIFVSGVGQFDPTPVTWTPPTAYDDSGRFEMMSLIGPGQFYHGETPVQYFVTDAGGNTNDCCIFFVYVYDDVCQPPRTRDCNDGVCIDWEGYQEVICACQKPYVGNCDVEYENPCYQCAPGYGGERCETPK